MTLRVDAGSTTELMVYVRTFFIAGVAVPIVLHMIASDVMPWWPDTVSMGVAFGVTAVLIVSRTGMERETNRRVWTAFKALMDALMRQSRSH